MKLFGNRINLDEVETLISRKLFTTVKCVGINDKKLIIFITNDEIDSANISGFVSNELKLHLSAIKIFKNLRDSFNI